MTQQLSGYHMTLEQAGTLRDNISTDEITPTTVMTMYDDRLANFPYVGYRAGNITPIGKGAIRQGARVASP